LKTGHGADIDNNEGGLPYICRLVGGKEGDDYLMTWTAEKDDEDDRRGIGDVLFDVGYVALLSDSARDRCRVPLSLARTANTLTEAQQREGQTFNAAFAYDPDDSSGVVWLIITDDIPPGGEVLVKYQLATTASTRANPLGNREHKQWVSQKETGRERQRLDIVYDTGHHMRKATAEYQQQLAQLPD
jgi:hypothetical protein